MDSFIKKIEQKDKKALAILGKCHQLWEELLLKMSSETEEVFLVSLQCATLKFEKLTASRHEALKLMGFSGYNYIYFNLDINLTDACALAKKLYISIEKSKTVSEVKKHSAIAAYEYFQIASVHRNKKTKRKYACVFYNTSKVSI